MNETNEQNQTETTSEATAEAKPKRKRKAAAPKAPVAKNKTAQARAIFKQLSRSKSGPNRQKVLERFMSEVKLSKAGASTYYQKFKTEFAVKSAKSAS